MNVTRCRSFFMMAAALCLDLCTAAKALGLDAFDMAVAGQQDLGHPAILAGHCSSPATKAGRSR